MGRQECVSIVESVEFKHFSPEVNFAAPGGGDCIGGGSRVRGVLLLNKFIITRFNK